MSKIQQIQKAMMEALKSHDMERKDALSLLLTALKAKAKDKRADLTEQEEDAIILKEIKQTRETMDSAPAGREDILGQCRLRISVMEEYAPKGMDESEIRKVIEGVLAELNITQPTGKDKGTIMKHLMSKVKGKADGGLVNKIVGEYIQ